jgi:hypothetical protein
MAGAFEQNEEVASPLKNSFDVLARAGTTKLEGRIDTSRRMRER